jgi:hypothetical protein
MRRSIQVAALASITFFASCVKPFGGGNSSSSFKDDQQTAESSENGATSASKEGYSTFAYYEGIRADGKRSASRNDGTGLKMPCITKEVIAAGQEVSYDFWHGHSGELHRFTLKVEDLEQLKQETSIEIFTAIVDGHKHAVKVDTKKPCKTK